MNCLVISLNRLYINIWLSSVSGSYLGCLIICQGPSPGCERTRHCGVEDEDTEQWLLRCPKWKKEQKKIGIPEDPKMIQIEPEEVAKFVTVAALRPPIYYGDHTHAHTHTHTHTDTQTHTHRHTHTQRHTHTHSLTALHCTALHCTAQSLILGQLSLDGAHFTTIQSGLVPLLVIILSKTLT